MEKLYEIAVEVARQLKVGRLEVVRLEMELKRVQYDMDVAKAQVERALIKRVGDEKKLSPNVAGRERIFILARDADEAYRMQLERYNGVYEQLDRAKIEVRYLQDKFNIMLTAIRNSI